MDSLIKRMQTLAFHNVKQINESLSLQDVVSRAQSQLNRAEELRAKNMRLGDMTRFNIQGQDAETSLRQFVENPEEFLKALVAQHGPASEWRVSVDPEWVASIYGKNGSVADWLSGEEARAIKDAASQMPVQEWDTDPGEDAAQRQEAIEANTEELIKTLAAKGLTAELIYHKIEQLAAQPVEPYSYESNEYLEGDDLANAIERITGIRPELTEGVTIQQLDMGGYASDFDRMLEMAGIKKNDPFGK